MSVGDLHPQLAGLEEHLPPSGAARPPQPRGGDAHQRLPAPAPGLGPQERHRPELHLVHGRLTFFLFLVETVTGVLLMFYYRPTLEHAYNDILALRDVATLGILRELHRWGAHAMVITIWLHMYRVFLTGSYKPPREFNWGVGVILLVLTLLLSFTGYLLPWDQLAIWAITVGSNMARATPFLGYEGPGRDVPARSAACH